MLNPIKSMRKMARHLGISRSIHRISKNYLELHDYKMQSRVTFKQLPCGNDMTWAKRFCQDMQCTIDNVFIWSNEKIFTVDAVTDTQNVKPCARDPRDLPKGNSSHISLMKPEGVMMWAAVSFDGSKTPSGFINEGVKLNSKLLSWITDSFGNGYIFIQDCSVP